MYKLILSPESCCGVSCMAQGPSNQQTTKNGQTDQARKNPDQKQYQSPRLLTQCTSLECFFTVHPGGCPVEQVLYGYSLCLLCEAAACVSTQNVAPEPGMHLELDMEAWCAKLLGNSQAASEAGKCSCLLITVTVPTHVPFYDQPGAPTYTTTGRQDSQSLARYDPYGACFIT